MYSNDVQWLSQNIFSHKDREYGTNGFIRVSMSTQTKDSQSFSAPNFNINIKNEGLNKTVSLPYQKIFELYNRLKEVVQTAGEEYSAKEGSPDTQLHFKTAKSTYLTIEFLRGQQGEPVVRMTISHGTSDSTKIIMPFMPEFHSLISLIGDMVSNRKYLDWCLHFPNRFHMVEMNEVMKQIPGLIKTAVVQIDNSRPESGPINDPDPEPEVTVDEENVKEIENTAKEFDAFLGDDMKNIELAIPFEKKDVKSTKPILENKMVKFLKGDVRNFENMIMRCSEKENPIREIEKELNNGYYDMEYFPGIKENEMNSILYLSYRELAIHNHNATSNPIQRSFSVNKYLGQKHAKPINIELAHDLLVLSIFFKLCRDKIENKSSDNYVNKTFLHIATSLNLSPFIFSFISSDTNISSIIKERFNQMNEAGMFDSYKKDEFKTYNFEITDRDMVEVAEELKESYLSSKSCMTDSYMRHVTLFNGKKCLLDHNHGINEEQIINQVLPFELYVIKNNKSLTEDKKDLLEFVKKINMESHIISKFIKTAPNKSAPIVKFFEQHESDIPEEIRNDFIKHIAECSYKDYDLSDKKFPYESFGEMAVKALYLWKPESGESFRTYKKFYNAITKSVHDKQTILSMITHDKVSVDGESFADFYSNAVK